MVTALLLSTALASPPQSTPSPPWLEDLPPADEAPKARFRAGDVQLSTGAGIELRGLSVNGLLAVIEGWQPAHLAVDVGLVNLGRGVTPAFGLEATFARQLLVNPALGVRRWLDRVLPDWLPVDLSPNDLIDYRWYPENRSAAARFSVHMNRWAGHPFLLGTAELHDYSLRIEERDTDATARTSGLAVALSFGAGVTSVTRSGLTMGASARITQRVWTNIPSSVVVGDGTVVTPRRMEPPPGFHFRGSVGYRF